MKFPGLLASPVVVSTIQGCKTTAPEITTDPIVLRQSNGVTPYLSSHSQVTKDLTPANASDQALYSGFVLNKLEPDDKLSGILRNSETCTITDKVENTRFTIGSQDNRTFQAMLRSIHR